MAESGAERQRGLRSKRRYERVGSAVEQRDRSEGEKRLDVWIRISASLALRRYAAHHGLSQREALERILIEVDATIPWDDTVTG